MDRVRSSNRPSGHVRSRVSTGLAISRAIVAIDVRYSIGLVDIDPAAPDTRNRVLAMTIGVGFRR